MKVWQDTFKELKSQYVVRSAERLNQIDERLNNLAKFPSDAGLLRDLMRQFHWLAGSGGIYGFAQITKLGTHGEQICQAILQSGKPFTASDWDKCKTLLDALRSVHVESTQESQANTVQDEMAPAARPADVVVVDVESGNSAMMTRLIHEQGLVFRTYVNAEQAFEAISQKLPQAIIISLPLPDSSGYDLVERIRALPDGELPVILIISSKNGFLDKVQAIHCGTDAYFEVPLDWEVMVQRLRHFIGRNKPQMYKLLSVEDDPDQAAYIRAVLENAGYRVQTCLDPKLFEEYLLSFQPDLVLLDIMLPAISGYELARYLRQDERYPTMPVLFLTTQNQLEAHIETARAGADDHLVKPVAPSLLLSAVSSRLERSRLLKTLLHRDGLTQLLSHSTFMEAAQAVIAQQKRMSSRYAALFILDVDQLRSINEKYGYSVGDRVLAHLATIVRQRLRASDTIGRYGGDELAVIVEDLEEHDAVTLAGRLLNDFAEKVYEGPDGTKFSATCSAGVVMLDAKVMDMTRWSLLAEQALKAANSSGGNCVRKAQGSGRS